MNTGGDYRLMKIHDLHNTITSSICGKHAQ